MTVYQTKHRKAHIGRHRKNDTPDTRWRRMRDRVALLMMIR